MLLLTTNQMDNGHEKIPWGWSKAIYKKYAKEATTTNHVSRGMVTSKLGIKRSHVNPSAIQVFFFYESLQKGPWNIKFCFERCDVIYNQGTFTLKTIESISLHGLMYKSCSQMIFPSLNFFVEKGLSTLVQKTLVEHVQLTLTTCLFVTCTFDL